RAQRMQPGELRASRVGARRGRRAGAGAHGLLAGACRGRHGGFSRGVAAPVMKGHSRAASEAAPDPDASAPAGEEAQDPAREPATAGAAETPPAEAPIDFKDRWLRAEADLQNYRRRSQRDREEAVRSTEERLLLEMIAQLDDLERALEAASESRTTDPWVQVVRLVAGRMVEFLARQGVTPMDAVGEVFDPELHEAM